MKKLGARKRDKQEDDSYKVREVDPSRGYISRSMLYDKNGSRGFLQKRPEQRSFFSSITGKETYLRYFMLDFDKRQLIIFSGDVSESLIDESGLKYQAFHMSFPKLLMQ